MPKPMAICIEDVSAGKFLRCVAVAGREPGLRVDSKGDVLWKSDEAVACELWVSADEKLILYRPDGARAVTLHRAGRSLDVPFGKPVVVIDRDEVDVGERRLRIHVHGDAPAVAAPSPFAPEKSTLGKLARAAAAAAVIGAGVGGCNTKNIVVRDGPPTPPPPPIDVRESPPLVVEPPGEAETKTPPEGQEKAPPRIEVREKPGDVARSKPMEPPGANE